MFLTFIAQMLIILSCFSFLVSIVKLDASQFELLLQTGVSDFVVFITFYKSFCTTYVPNAAQIIVHSAP